MKRVIALFLVCIILMQTLVGCASTSADTALTMGQWVTLIADSFGLQNYIEETPHFSKVLSSEPTFSAFQSVAEWNIIEPSEEITASTPVKWNDVLISLVNAGEFLDANATDKDKIDFAIKNFDPSIRTYWGNRYIKMKEAVPLLDTAQGIWANKIFSEKIEKATFDESVTNCIDNENIDYISNGDVITTDSDELKNLKAGDVYTLPANADNDASINRVKAIEYVDGKIVITNDADFTEEAGEYVQEVKLQETSALDFTQVAGIYDESGNPINFESGDSLTPAGMSASLDDNACRISTLAYTTHNSEPMASQLGIFDNVKGTLKFKVGKYSASITLTKDSFGVKLAKEIKKSTNRYKEQKQEIYVSSTFKDVELTKAIDYSWGELHSATIRLDYNTTIEGGIKTERSDKIGSPVGKDGETTKSLASIFDQYKSALADLKNTVNNSKCQDDIYICRLHLIGNKFASVDLIVKGKVTAAGDIKIVVEVEGSQGIQIKDGKFRYIKEKDVDVDFAAEGSLEVTVGPGIAVTILKKISIIEITIDCGLGASVGVTAHLFDVEGHELYSGTAQLTAEDAEALSSEKMYTTAAEIEKFAKEKGGTWDAEKKGITGDITIHKGICLEWKLYPIVRLGIDGKSEAGKIAKKFGVNVSVEILGSKNTKLQGHIDFPNNLSEMLKSDSLGGGLSALLGIGAECTYDYTPWDEAIEETEKIDPATETGDIKIADTIVISTMRVEVDEGGSAQIHVTGLPKGYKLKDIEATSEDPDVATIDVTKGEITGIKEGITQIVVKTKDGKHKAVCAVVVTTDSKVNFSGLSNGSGV